MKKTKKLFLLALSILTSAFSAFTFSSCNWHTIFNGFMDEVVYPIFRGFETDGVYYYEINEDKKSYSIVGINDIRSPELVIPSSFNGKPVTCISGGYDSTYYDNDYDNGVETVTKVTLPISITTIGEAAFANWEGLTSIEIPISVTSIGCSAFYGCYNLTSLTIPDSVTSIGDKAFYWCINLTSVNLSDNIVSIGEDAFEGCDNLNFITWENGANGKYLQINANQLALIEGESEEDAYIHPNTKIIADGAFSETSIKYIDIPEGVSYIGTAFAGCDYLQSIIIPNGVTFIVDGAFSGCKNLQTISIGKGVTFIASGEYNYDSEQFSITDWSGNLIYAYGPGPIRMSAFSGCESLKYILVDEDNEYYTSSLEGDLYTKDGKTLIQYAVGKTTSTFIIPDGVTKIATYAFAGAYSLSTMFIPNSVTLIEGSVFGNNINNKGLNTVYYQGTKQDWKKISINSVDNERLNQASIYYYSEKKPADKGNYWYYDENGEIAVW